MQQSYNTNITTASKASTLKLAPLSGLVPPLGLFVVLWLWLRKGLRTLALITLVVTIAAAGLYLYFYQELKGAPSNDKPGSYTYEQLQDYRFGGLKNGLGVELKKPTEFTEDPKESSRPRKTLVHKVQQDDTQSYLGGLSILTVPATPQDREKNLPMMREGLSADAPADKYKAASDLVSVITDMWLPDQFEASFARAKPFSSANIKQDAWQFDFTAIDPKNPKTPKLHGKAIYAYGNNGVYILGFAAAGGNWQSNSKLWEQVINSIKLDQ